MSTPEPTVEETLGWEAEQRPRAGVAAFAAGILILAGNIIGSLLAGDQPRVLLIDGLRDAAGERLPSGQGLLSQQLHYYADHKATLIVEGLVSGVGLALLAVVLGYLFRATQNRRPELPRVAIYLALLGPVLLGVATLAQRIALAAQADDFVGGGKFDTKTAHDAVNGGVTTAMQILQAPAVLMTAIAFVLVAINAMRVGLLTRFMGILGIITGALLLFPIGGSPVVVQTFWLLAIGALILGRWPNGVPPAWESGRAEPWPSQQELREAREAARAQAGDPAPAPAGAPEAPAATPHSASKKRKRKRR